MSNISSHGFNRLRSWERQSLEKTFENVSMTLANDEEFCSKVEVVFKKIMLKSDYSMGAKIHELLIWSLDFESSTIWERLDPHRNRRIWTKAAIYAVDEIGRLNLMAEPSKDKIGEALKDILVASKLKATCHESVRDFVLGGRLNEVLKEFNRPDLPSSIPRMNILQHVDQDTRAALLAIDAFAAKWLEDANQNVFLDVECLIEAIEASGLDGLKSHMPKLKNFVTGKLL